MADSHRALSAAVLRSVLDQLTVAIFVFRRHRLVYANPSATRLVNRLRSRYNVELIVMLLDHLTQTRDGESRSNNTALALTGTDNEPFVARVMELGGRHHDLAVSIREIGTELSAFKDRFQLSRRELQIAELVLRGHRNTEIATALGITLATTKKHLSRIFDKVGVNSRAQLVAKLA